jgi:hypothetical protein
MDQFTVTKEWLLDNTTNKGAWNAKQLGCLGIDWPPRKGWIKRADGILIDIVSRERFERLAGEPAREKITIQDQELRIRQLERELSEIKDYLCTLGANI